MKLNTMGGRPWFRVWMPYTYIKLKHLPGHTYLPINRLYNPLGNATKGWSDWGKADHQAVRFTRDPHAFKGVWTNPELLYLYMDGTDVADYFERFKKLMSHGVRWPE